jgi:hypothetical protein
VLCSARRLAEYEEQAGRRLVPTALHLACVGAIAQLGWRLAALSGAQDEPTLARSSALLVGGPCPTRVADLVAPLTANHAEPTQEGKQIIEAWVKVDELDPTVRQQLTGDFHRNLVLESANNDLVVGSRLGAAISLDRLHTSIASARLRRGDAELVFGSRALEILLPGEIEWEDIDRLRCHPGIADYRSVLSEIEQAALGDTTSTSMPSTSRMPSARTPYATMTAIDTTRPPSRTCSYLASSQIYG